MARLLKNEFSWSKSRDETFRLCPRRYYYEYYGSWGGWEEGAPPAVRELWVLKKLKSRQAWVGDLVHRAIERSVLNISRSIPVLPVERIVEITLNLMRNEFRSSRRGNYREGKGVGLLEHEYAVAVPDEEWRAAADLVEGCLRRFYASPIFAGLASRGREHILEVEKLASFDFEGTRCWVVLDAAWREEGSLVIADWKTGRAAPGGVELQMTCYALYAAARWGTEPQSLTLLEYNLSQDRVHRYRADGPTVERTRSYIRGSVADMRGLLREGGGNTPLPEERFARIAEGATCGSCNYRRVCRPGGPGQPH